MPRPAVPGDTRFMTQIAPPLLMPLPAVSSRILRAVLAPVRMLLIVVWSVLFVLAQAVQGLGLVALFIAARIPRTPAN